MTPMTLNKLPKLKNYLAEPYGQILSTFCVIKRLFKKVFRLIRFLTMNIWTKTWLKTLQIQNTRKLKRLAVGTLFEIFIFCPKIQLWFPEKIVEFVLGENSRKCCGNGLFSCWQLWFHEKNCPKNLGEKLVKMLGFCQNWIFWTKIWLFE